MDSIKLVLSNKQFWALLVILINELQKYLLPDIPETLWSAGIGLFLFVMTVMFVQEVRAVRASRAAMKAQSDFKTP
jgi:hypothetical protein